MRVMNGKEHAEAGQLACCWQDALANTGRQLELIVGSQGISAKDQIVLRSLLKVMDGQQGLALKFSEEISDCNVVLMPEHWVSQLPTACVSVCLLSENAPANVLPQTALSVRSPLRLSNTSTMLHMATRLLDQEPSHAVVTNGLDSLLNTLLQNISAKEKNTLVVPFSDGSDMIVNFVDERYYSPMPIERLLKGEFQLGDPRVAKTAELSTLAEQEVRGLRRLIWQATHRVSDAAQAGVALSGHYRLLRWPDAVALSHPRFPRLAALLTSRAQTVEQASAASGASVMEISCFLKTNLALGIAEAVDVVKLRKPIFDAGPAVNPGFAHAVPAPSMLGRIRDRLKLW